MKTQIRSEGSVTFFVPNALDALTSGFPRIIDSSCLYLIFIPSTTTTTNLAGNVVWTQG